MFLRFVGRLVGEEEEEEDEAEVGLRAVLAAAPAGESASCTMRLRLLTSSSLGTRRDEEVDMMMRSGG